MKVVINSCYGGFSVSKDVYEELGLEWDGFGFLYPKELGLNDSDEVRCDPRLIKAIEDVGLRNASGDLASLTIVKIPDDVKWYIDDYDGVETVHEEHRSWM